MKKEGRATQGRHGWQMKSEGWAEEGLTGPWGLQITHRGGGLEALFSLPGINRQQQNQPSLTLETWILASYSRKRPRRNGCVDVNLCHRFASLRSCSHPAQSLFIFSEAAASLFPPSSSHPGSRLPGCLSEGRQQVFCDSEIREPRRDGAPLSSAACVGGGGGEKAYASIFRDCPHSCNRKERLSHPRAARTPVQYQRVCLIHAARSCTSPPSRVRSLVLRSMRAEVSLGRGGDVGAHMHGLIWKTTRRRERRRRVR